MSNTYTQTINFNPNFIAPEYLFHSRNGALLDELIRCYTVTIPNAHSESLQAFERELRRENGRCIEKYESKKLGAQELEKLVMEWARKRILGNKKKGKGVGGGGRGGGKVKGQRGRFDAVDRM